MSFTPDEPIPIVIYRVSPAEAYQLGVLGEAVPEIDKLRDYSERHPHTQVPAQNIRPLAGLSNAEGLARSRTEKTLWLVHPQLGELQKYHGEPPLLALQQSYGFYEAYLPDSSSLVPYQWLSEAELQVWRSRKNQAVADEESELWRQPWLGSESKQALLGTVMQHLTHWQKLGIPVLSPTILAKREANAVQTKQAVNEVRPEPSQEIPQAAMECIPLQPKYRKKKQRKFSGYGSPPQAWLEQAEQAVQNLKNEMMQEAGTANGIMCKDAQIAHLTRAIWALFAFWVSARLRPDTVLRKLSAWLRLEAQHQTLEARLRQEVAERELPQAREQAAQEKKIQVASRVDDLYRSP